MNRRAPAVASINWTSISKKVEKAINTPQVKKKIESCANRKITASAQEAAQQFVDILQKSIAASAGENYASGDLGTAAIQALLSLNFNTGAPYKQGNNYIINISFDGDKYRESLSPAQYDGINNIVALLNSGYTAGHTVYGVWKGHTDGKIPSLTKRGGAHFIEQAINEFMRNYARYYDIKDIQVSDIYI